MWSGHKLQRLAAGDRTPVKLTSVISQKGQKLTHFRSGIAESKRHIASRQNNFLQTASKLHLNDINHYFTAARSARKNALLVKPGM